MQPPCLPDVASASCCAGVECLKARNRMQCCVGNCTARQTPTPNKVVLYLSRVTGALTAALSWYRANFQAALFGQTRPRTGFPLIQVPTLGVWSTGDTALTEQQMLASEQYVAPGLWQYRRLDGGHWVPRDAPTALSQVLLDFLGDAQQSVKVSKL